HRVAIERRHRAEVARDPIVVIVSPEHRIEIPGLPVYRLVPILLAPLCETCHAAAQTLPCCFRAHRILPLPTHPVVEGKAQEGEGRPCFPALATVTFGKPPKATQLGLGFVEP